MTRDDRITLGRLDDRRRSLRFTKPLSEEEERQYQILLTKYKQGNNS